MKKVTFNSKKNGLVICDFFKNRCAADLVIVEKYICILIKKVKRIVE